MPATTVVAISRRSLPASLSFSNYVWVTSLVYMYYSPDHVWTDSGFMRKLIIAADQNMVLADCSCSNRETAIKSPEAQAIISKMSSHQQLLLQQSTSAPRVPVGIRFHPTDEELVGHYLPNKVAAKPIDLDLIRDLDLYKLEPWDLDDLCKVQADDSNQKQTDYYFFSRKDKYATGNRAKRATPAGFWKASGVDKPIHNKLQQLIGMRKTLVFYQGRGPRATKTEWIMHEFRLDDGLANEDGGWVVCRVSMKTKSFKPDYSSEKQLEGMPQDMSFAEIIPDMSRPEMLFTTNSAAAAGGGEGMSCSYGRGNSFPAIQNMTLQGEAHHHQHQGPVSLAATHSNSKEAFFTDEAYYM
ncbi:unnamed protein product [Sphagnum balticum]